MAILTTINTEILGLSCERQVLTKWKAYMVCTHIVGVWKFLRISAGADPVKACFCIICPYYVNKVIINCENNIKEIRAIFNSRSLHDVMNEIKQENDIVIVETCTVAYKIGFPFTLARRRFGAPTLRAELSG